MNSTGKHSVQFVILGTLLILLFVVNIALGSVLIPLKAIIQIILGDDTVKEAWQYIILDYRIPKALAAIMTGSGLAVAGLMMQTLFKNPLAGPFVLGISSGASLGVAFFILGGSALGLSAFVVPNGWGTILAASLGSFAVLSIVLLVASRVRDAMALLIIGLMFGSLTAAVVSILAYFSPAEELQRYMFWSFGSLGDISWDALIILSFCYFIGMILAFSVTKSLNSLLLGDHYAQTLGVSLQKSRFIILIATSILAGSLTAFVGPIAFVGLAVPHLIRQWFTASNHWTLMPACVLGGAVLMLFCDTLAQMPLFEFSLPINAITSIIGAPVVIWLLIRKKKLLF
ncbi:iron complex transport system permease protein [Leeuwenhoekiella aestuarii]|uniref:Iron complex transport system permease protein n=1 Tax=Leeuwenhoekiella aestuarii TaxID=2249426 RepID=A0A4Q0NWE9_9FLAO|nr:iron ABC transporter permease [Leeuwenhoekiella aestuarii]RXG15646.1 iron complex transport system permease protein [Leeuwenhoekiella aestuarii]RXG17245.1 iron complex transport system permease protein [Leeuwenhoekiella aestuarii]